MSDQTFGQWIAARLEQVVDSVMTPMPDADGVLVPFPEMLIYADTEHTDVIDSPQWLAYEDRLTEIMGRVALEGVLLAIGSCDVIDVAVDEPFFPVLADMLSSFYTRGFLLGMVQGEAAAPSQERMDAYIQELVTDIDAQMAARGKVWTGEVEADLLITDEELEAWLHDDEEYYDEGETE